MLLCPEASDDRHRVRWSLQRERKPRARGLARVGRCAAPMVRLGRELAAQAGELYGGSLSALVAAVSFCFLNEALIDLDEHFGTFLAVTPVLAKTPTMKTLIDDASHLLRLNASIEPHLIELGYVPMKDPMAEADG